MTTAIDIVEDMVEHVDPGDIRFPRHWFFVLGGVLVGWLAFWELCERHPDNPHAQLMAWLFILVTVYLCSTF